MRVPPFAMPIDTMAICSGDARTLDCPNAESIVAPDLRVLEQLEPTVFGQAISQQTAATMTQMMVDAVSNGAGSNARIDGVDVAGKTGTAENDEGDPYTLWFTGFAPANDPQVAVAVVVENGGGLGQSGSGNQVAAPIAQRVLEAVLFK